ncbi:hypothetical protein [Phytohabitans kaempferiae]|uniref:Uncharacterized protein n=1 Tax=Phytohabitans kaempferiae TaxID=1620943 RepID=A0ABV6MEY7_9ACTN
MTDLYKSYYEQWFERSCRYAELLGGIKGWLEATEPNGRYGLPPVTADRALTEIRRLVDQFDSQQKTVTGGDRQ